MLYSNVNIDNLAYELPEQRVTSEEIEDRLKPVYERLKLPAGRLQLMTGIVERRFWDVGTLPSDGAYRAGLKAIQNSSIPKEKIGCLIMCSVCRDFLEPATATVVHNQLGLSSDSMVFDLSNACLGILSGMITLGNMIELGQVEAGLLVACENSRSLVDNTINTILTDGSLTRQSIKPLFASLTIGSGASAVLMAKRELCDEDHRLLGGATISNTMFNDLCRGNSDKGMNDDSDTLMKTDSEALMVRGIDTAKQTWDKFRNELSWNASSIDHICTHQVGVAHKKLMLERLDISRVKDFSTVEKLGNIGSVSCPITTAMAIDEGVIKRNQNVAMLGIGSGINCTMLGVKW